MLEEKYRQYKLYKMCHTHENNNVTYLMYEIGKNLSKVIQNQPNFIIWDINKPQRK